jgi:hypothetical protein
MEELEFKQCPFCGNPFPEHDVAEYAPSAFMRCVQCGAHGPFCHTRKDAQKLWNTRAEIGHPEEFIPELVRLCAHYGAVIFARTDGRREILSVELQKAHMWLDYERINGDGAQELGKGPEFYSLSKE